MEQVADILTQIRLKRLNERLPEKGLQRKLYPGTDKYRVDIDERLPPPYSVSRFIADSNSSKY